MIIPKADMPDTDEGPTGAICFDLPSPYEPHPCGLLHLPRFIAKIRKHLAGELPKSYQKNFRRGFDRFLCLHLGIDPDSVVEAVAAAGDGADLERRLAALLTAVLFSVRPAAGQAPADWQQHVVYEMDREVTHKGQTEAGREFLRESLENMGHPEMAETVICVCDLIDFDEGRIPGFSHERRREWELANRPAQPDTRS